MFTRASCAQCSQFEATQEETGIILCALLASVNYQDSEINASILRVIGTLHQEHKDNIKNR